MESYKSTMWEELKPEDCIIRKSKRGRFSGIVEQVQIKHPALKRARWFSLSRAGNWYSRYTGNESDCYAEGYIIKDFLDTSTSQSETLYPQPTQTRR